MHPLIALALVVFAGIGVTRLTRAPLRQPAPLAALVAAGAPFVLLGVVLSRGLGVLDSATLRALSPVVALAIGWIGATFGAQLEWQIVRRWSLRVWVTSAAIAAVVFVASAHTAWILARAAPGLGAAWGPTIPVVLTIAAAATVTLADGTRRGALIDTLLAAMAGAAAIALSYPTVARSVVLTLAGGGLLAALFLALARWRPPSSGHTPTLGIELAAVVLLGAGFAHAARLSPFLVCAVMTGVVVSVAPPSVRDSVRALLRHWEPTLYAAFLILAGALARLDTIWLIGAGGALLLVRVATRWVIRRKVALLPPGAAAVAIAAAFDLVRGDTAPGAFTVVTTALVLVLLAQMAAAAPLTAPTRGAEVT